MFCFADYKAEMMAQIRPAGPNQNLQISVYIRSSRAACQQQSCKRQAAFPPFPTGVGFSNERNDIEANPFPTIPGVLYLLT
jgi:hypothetical protein